MSAKCHVWTAPSWQELSSRLQQPWSVQPCVRPLSAAHEAAGHNALRGSGPDQKHAFNHALAQVGCPDRRIDRLCITFCSPFQPSHHAEVSGARPIRPDQKSRIFPAALRRGTACVVAPPPPNCPHYLRNQQRRKERFYCDIIIHRLSGIRRHTHLCFEPISAFRAGPKIKDVPLILVFRPFRGNQ